MACLCGLKDVATVVDSVEEERTAAWMFQDRQMKRTVMLIVMRQPNSNVVATNDAVKALLPQIEKQLPPSVMLRIRGDRSKTIRESFQDVQFTLIADDRHGDPRDRPVPA